MKTTWDAMMEVAAAESRVLNVRKTACNGSMLKGYTAKQGIEVTPDVLLHMSLDLNAAIEHLQEAYKKVQELRNN